MEITILLILLMGGAALSSFSFGGDGDDDAGSTDAELPPINTIQGTADADVLIGTVGLDQIFGDAGDDILDGGEGNDTLYGETGVDTAFGGAGDDLIDLRTGNRGVGFGGSGEDTVIGTEDGWNILIGAGHESYELFEQDGTFTGFEDYDRDADVLRGGNERDFLYFSGGDDATGGGGNDFFFLHDVQGILESGLVAVVHDFSEGEYFKVIGEDVNPTWETDGDDVLIKAGAETIAVLKSAAAFFTDDNFFTRDAIDNFFTRDAI